MYEKYWQLENKPFENTSDARFYYPGEAHQGALLKLRYAIENRRGLAVLSGVAGLGKTLLAQAMADQLNEQFSPVVHLVFPQMPPDQLLAYLADELTGDTVERTSPVAMDQSVRRIQKTLKENSAQNRHAVVMVDEAHLLADTGALETMRLLLNMEYAQGPALTLLLIGQTSLLTSLDRAPQLDSRVDVKCLLRPFTREESVSYIAHRMRAAGAQTEIFTPDAVESIHELTAGVPRRINRLCDLALLISYAEECARIDGAQIESVSSELVTVTPE
ncbi:ExeA family protein [Lignipirellula cremea]|uniref:ATPase family associated with various cellular activities (AAA) n=1 Tax=Lignipirellula cremea TaxID=2528010 RepID=A0A518E1B4_9BACT|nr:AAA family ATPase [Lignipirellula cremea]QDU97880.1 ATPase family associated with various cellular activities (AAA) [Lignipirellula cremea]